MSVGPTDASASEHGPPGGCRQSGGTLGGTLGGDSGGPYLLLPVFSAVIEKVNEMDCRTNPQITGFYSLKPWKNCDALF